jgi:hypothetical protein
VLVVEATAGLAETGTTVTGAATDVGFGAGGIATGTGTEIGTGGTEGATATGNAGTAKGVLVDFGFGAATESAADAVLDDGPVNVRCEDVPERAPATAAEAGLPVCVSGLAAGASTFEVAEVPFAAGALDDVWRDPPVAFARASVKECGPESAVWSIGRATSGAAEARVSLMIGATILVFAHFLKRQ